MTKEELDKLECPFSEDQLRWLSAREYMLSAHGTEWSRRHLRSYAKRALAGFLILGAGLAGAFYTSNHDAVTSRNAIVKSGRVVSVAGCNRDYITVNRLRNVLARSLDFQKAALARGDISQDQFDRAQIYFQQQLDGLPPVDCRSSATIITDDPANIGPVPTPLFPPKPPFSGPH